MNVTWKQGLILPHDPDDIGDITLDMTDVVGTGAGADTLASATVVGVNITAALVSTTTAGVVVFRISGGTAGGVGTVTTKIIMTSGRKQSRTINFNILER